MITRRRALAGGTALAAVTPAAAWAAPPDVQFEVLRNGTNIGQHITTFSQEGDALLAIVAVNLAVRLGPIVLFRYTHSVRETWRNGQFVMLDSETNDDGKPFKVHAFRSGGQVAVEVSNGPRAMLPAETIPLTHWNILCMERPLFNPQDGVPITSKFVPRGEEMVGVANGAKVRAAHYSLVGKVALDDWYNDERQWTALRSIGTDRSTIDYRRVV